MASKRRIRRKSCGNKRRYMSGKEAQDAAIMLRRRTGDYTEVYKCPWCQHYHHGHITAAKKHVRKELGYR